MRGMEGWYTQQPPRLGRRQMKWCQSKPNDGDGDATDVSATSIAGLASSFRKDKKVSLSLSLSLFHAIQYKFT